jgi:hypothetical protein
MPTQIIIKSFVNINPRMVFTKIITIILGIGISMVGYTNEQNDHKKFREYQTCDGIESTSHD